MHYQKPSGQMSMTEQEALLFSHCVKPPAGPLASEKVDFCKSGLEKTK
jgi:hypothetical protein